MNSYRLSVLFTAEYAKSFYDPLSLTCTKSHDSPADWLEVSFSVDSPVDEIRDMVLYWGAEILFVGRCDSQEVTCDKGGTILTIQARGLGCDLLDNEAKPQVYNRISLSQLFKKHLGPYGFDRILGQFRDRYVQDYAISKGTSEWEAFAYLATMTTGHTPYIRDWDVILGENPKSSTYVVSHKGGIPYLSIKSRINRKKVISQIVLRDDNGNYSATVTSRSAVASAIRRRRYSVPAPEWASSVADDASQKIKDSFHQKETCVLTLPTQAVILIGDRVVCDDPLVPSYLTHVCEVEYSLSKKGHLTTVTLCNPSYI